MRTKVDQPFLFSVAILTIAGFFIFSSASLGLLAQKTSVYSSVTFKQIFFGLFLGTLAMLAVSRISFKVFRQVSLIFFIVSILLTLAVFIPGLGIEHGGAHRWIDLGFISFQPAEILKIGYVLYLAAYLAHARKQITTVSGGLIPFLAITAVVAGVLLIQPDTDNFLVIATAGLAMFLVAGGKIKHILMIVLAGVLMIGFLALTRPYVRDRIITFLDPSRDALGSSYQIQQSFIAIGSGQMFGRGFGQSIQKFNFLPEPIGDSIFAVFSEEFGFFGAIILIGLFIFFAVRGLKIASNTTDPFGRLVVVGLVILIISQAFVNIAGMLGVIPLSGISLPFVSHGGTALLVALVEAGIILSISRKRT
ncbi:MAG: hypothetical protein COV34_02195 [Candidatus Zambryskibacteria bacterium CG10_big_fil_rev_8_21_14_0_10_42_12]|uniref:Probable peptidoglycan glycosyltransferase FtsW n=1 Tax=Candidatus Zambryskibacteria bacterium CG10_big_fil_rev_8_21_14_0_10_42_12 TaxID=1975115 RepID=A0A2H0QXM8_9BACT|nr:MAG: hypothetical protein COV34_02195 [Candidatus Zambryskibacteria bacterium CG10_big_fil_rev_8_21_14_0_10_42_12]